MPGYAEILIYLAVVGAVWAAYRVRTYRRAASKPQRGAADAYDGNVVILPPGHPQRGRLSFRSSSGSRHLTHGHVHAEHFGGHHAGIGHP